MSSAALSKFLSADRPAVETRRRTATRPTRAEFRARHHGYGAARYQFSEAEMAEQSRLVPLGNMASHPADIADVLVFLASHDAHFMTHATVHANGGLYMA
jgi:NAD(P)-dependent dehydrogenase (short-subunit alcohol dehydrogenase family)